MTKNRLQNIGFQYAWFVLKKMLPAPKKLSSEPGDLHIQISAQIVLAWFFGGVKAVIWGDSNGYAFTPLETMKLFDMLTINIARPGSTSHQWGHFWKSGRGENLREILSRSVIIMNVGGNNCLQSKMVGSVKTFVYFKRIFSDLVGISIPIIHYSAFTPMMPDVVDRTNRIDKYIELNSKYFLDADIYTDSDKDGIPDPGSLVDLIHYSPQTLEKMVVDLNKLVEFERNGTLS